MTKRDDLVHLLFRLRGTGVYKGCPPEEAKDVLADLLELLIDEMPLELGDED